MMLAALFGGLIALPQEAEGAGGFTLDAWVMSKVCKAGDTIEINARTSTTDGVTVTADIVFYDVKGIDETTPLKDLEVPKTVVDTVPLTYDAAANIWKKEYQVKPSSDPGLYGIDVTATYGNTVVKDNCTSFAQDFYDNQYLPVLNVAKTFINGDWNTGVSGILDEVDELETLIESKGGLPGIIQNNITGLPEWGWLVENNSAEFPDACWLLEDFATYTQGADFAELWDNVWALEAWLLRMMVPDTTDVNDLLEQVRAVNSFEESFLDNVSLIYGLDTFTAAYGDMQATTQYTDFKAALTAFETEKTPETIDALLDKFIALIVSDAAIEVLNATANKFENMTGISEQMDGLFQTSEAEALGRAVMVGVIEEIFEQVNGSAPIIEGYAQNITNSTQLEDFYWAMDALGNYTESEWMEEWNRFSSIESPETYTYYYNVTEWMKWLELDYNAWFEWYDPGDGSNTNNGSVKFELTSPANVKYTEEVKNTDSLNEHEGFGTWSDSGFFDPGHDGENITRAADTTGTASFSYTYVVSEDAKDIGIDLWGNLWDDMGEKDGDVACTVTDPDGSSFDIGPKNNGPYDHEVEGVEIESPSAGTWTFDIFTEGNGSFNLNVNTWGDDEILVMYPEDGKWTLTVTAQGQGDFDFEVNENDIGQVLMIETVDSLFYVVNMGLVANGNLIETVGTTTTVSFQAFDGMGAVAGADLKVMVLKVDPNITFEPEDIENITDVPFLFQDLADSSVVDIVYGQTLTTDANGKATVSFAVDRAVYAVVAQAVSGDKIGMTVTGVVGMPYKPTISLPQVGTVAGIPIYKSSQPIGEDVSLTVTIPTGKSAAIRLDIEPMDFDDIFGYIPGVEYNSTEYEKNITSSATFDVRFNGPVNFFSIGADDEYGHPFPDGANNPWNSALLAVKWRKQLVRRCSRQE
jgi:hypothetical protein